VAGMGMLVIGDNEGVFARRSTLVFTIVLIALVSPTVTYQVYNATHKQKNYMLTK